MTKTIVQVLGPTGVGKSVLAVHLAEGFNGEIISADAFQVYRGFDIGTAKTPLAERRGIPHHLVDIEEGGSQFNAWHFLQRSFSAAAEISGRGRLPIVCGGTALYLRLQISGIFPEFKDDGATRRLLKKDAEERGLDALWHELAAADPVYAQKIGPTDRLRVIRGLEIVRLNGVGPSILFARNQSPFFGSRFIRIGLNLERAELYRRIDRRVEAMFAAGWVDEVRRLLLGHSRQEPAFRGLGYREIADYIAGRMDLAETVRLIQQNSRRFAKRQLTWFRREKDITWFDPGEKEKIVAHLHEELWKKP